MHLIRLVTPLLLAALVTASFPAAADDSAASPSPSPSPIPSAVPSPGAPAAETPAVSATPATPPLATGVPSPTPSPLVQSSSGAPAAQASSVTQGTGIVVCPMPSGNGSGLAAGVDARTVLQNAQLADVSASGPAPGAATNATAAELAVGGVARAAGPGSAIGVSSEDTVRGVTEGTIEIEGGSEVPVWVANGNVIAIRGIGAAGLGASQAPTQLALPAARSAVGCAVGTVRTNHVYGTLDTAVFGTSPSGGLRIRHEQTVTLASAGEARGAACALCDGAARAVGVESETSVAAEARAAVEIGGTNYAPVEVGIELVTHIDNEGRAAAASIVAAVGESVRSGIAAVGAIVANVVELGSRIMVSIAGDNREPIDIDVRLNANLANSGTAATADTNGSATGLRASNGVFFRSNVGVKIERDNYAPISIRLRHVATISNAGSAIAGPGGSALATPLSVPVSCLGGSISTLAVNGQIARVTTETGRANEAVNSMAHHQDAAGDAVCASARGIGGSGEAFAVGAGNTLLLAGTQQAIAAARSGQEPEGVGSVVPIRDAGPATGTTGGAGLSMLPSTATR